MIGASERSDGGSCDRRRRPGSVLAGGAALSDGPHEASRPALWRVALRHWRIMVACLCVALVIAGAFSLLTTPTYSSSLEVDVRPTAAEPDPGTAYEGNLLASGLAQSYAHLMTGTVVVGGVVRELGLSTSVADLQSRIVAAPVTDTSLIAVTASDSDPARAARIAESAVAQLHAYLVKLAAPAAAPIADVIIVEPASLPTSPSAPKPVQDLGIGAVLGILVGLGAATWLDRRRQAPLALAAPTSGPAPRRHAGATTVTKSKNAGAHSHRGGDTRFELDGGSDQLDENRPAV